MFFVPTSLIAATPEVRGTWLTTTGPDHIRTGANTEAVMADLRQIGLNTVYTETWKNGYTNPAPMVKSTLRTFCVGSKTSDGSRREWD